MLLEREKERKRKEKREKEKGKEKERERERENILPIISGGSNIYSSTLELHEADHT